MTCDNIFNINKINKNDILIKNKHCFILIDTETCNGIDKENNAIVQLAFNFLGTDYIFNSYCKPNENIPWRIKYERYIPTITKEKVHNSPLLKNVLISFNNIIHCLNNVNPILIAHNSCFDKDILELCFNNYSINLYDVTWCNTMNKLFFNIKDENNKYIKSLEKIYKNLFHGSNTEFHNAKNDVEILYNCLLKVHKNDDTIISIVLSSFKITNSIYVKNGIYIYVLLLNDYNFYIGYTENIVQRLYNQLLSTTPCSWVKKHKPIAIYEIIKNTKSEYVKYKILEFMKKYGWQSVRGTTWSNCNMKCPPKELENFTFNNINFDYATSEEIRNIMKEIKLYSIQNSLKQLKIKD